jgi:hypothetical protein
MHEASDDDTGEPEVAATDAAATDAVATDAVGIEALPLADRAPRYQEVADRLRADLERSDPARGDA